MTVDDFRALALALDGTTEGAHMGKADFRVRGKIFATLGYPDERHGVVMISPQEQEFLMRDYPNTFAPAAGAWGKAGNTTVLLPGAPKRIVAIAIESAWSRRQAKK